MKRFLPVFLIVIVLLASFSFISYAATGDMNNPVYSVIPQPETSDRVFYFAHETALFEFRFLSPFDTNTLYSELFYDGTTQTSDGYSSYRPFDIEVDAFMHFNPDENRFTFTAKNYTLRPVICECFVYYLTTGRLQNSWFTSVPAGRGQFIQDENSQLVMELLPGSNTLSNLYPVRNFYMPFNCSIGSNYLESLDLPRLNVVWASDTALHNDFLTVRTFLSSFESTFSNMLSELQQIESNQDTLYSLVSGFLNDFFNTDWEDAENYKNWSYYLEMVQSFSYNMTVFARDFNSWYQSVYTPKTDLTNQLLQDIYDILNDPEATTVPPETNASQAVNDYRDAEASMMQDQAQNVEGALDGVNNFFTDGNGGIGGALNFVLSSVGEIITSHMAVTSLIIFSLGFGIILLILGRRVN